MLNVCDDTYQAVDTVVNWDFRSRTRQALQEVGESETYKLVTQFLKVRDPPPVLAAIVHPAHLSTLLRLRCERHAALGRPDSGPDR